MIVCHLVSVQFDKEFFFNVSRYVESNPQYAESGVYLVKFRQHQVHHYAIFLLILRHLFFEFFENNDYNFLLFSLEH